MKLADVFQSLRLSVSKHAALYAAAAPNSHALASYATPGALLDALKMSSPLSPEARDAIILALIAEQQRAAHPLWQTLLLAAFEPMLRRLAGRAKGRDEGEGAQRVVVAFLEAVQAIATLHPPSKAAAHLRRETERVVFKELRGDRKRDAMEQFDEEQIAVANDPHSAFVAGEDKKRFAAEMARIAGSPEAAAELADVIVATRGGWETLTEYVERAYANASEEEKRLAYGRLQRQRHRAMEKLKSAVGQ